MGAASNLANDSHTLTCLVRSRSRVYSSRTRSLSPSEISKSMEAFLTVGMAVVVGLQGLQCGRAARRGGGGGKEGVYDTSWCWYGNETHIRFTYCLNAQPMPK